MAGLITLSDLECDYLNAQQCCSRLNVWVMPKLVVHSLLLITLLILGQWALSALNFPVTVWLFYEYFNIPSGNMGVYDPTEIHNRGPEICKGI
ncbi:protein cornichon homolog 4-like [Belonocnema kinseyi]|uniref:protein cornichon homolog 4-like n=1 Tax=Belonocnema kinseyi TaxID=2817044 RepID=UPI00143DB512|nr:protein cornichon homolog 4-like [Belonocnema kinseyi]